MPRQPKSRSRVIVDEAYFNLILARSDLFDEIFEDVDTPSAIITAELFKTAKRLHTKMKKLPNHAFDVDRTELVDHRDAD
jgi:hypothetical protein